MPRSTHVKDSTLVFGIAQDLEASQSPLARRRQKDGIDVNVPVRGCSLIVNKRQCYLVLKVIDRVREEARPHTDIL